MELDITLPETGSFKNKAGQTIEWQLDPNDRTKCTIRVDGKKLDMIKYLEQEALRLKEIEDISKGAGILNPVSSEDK